MSERRTPKLRLVPTKAGYKLEVRYGGARASSGEKRLPKVPIGYLPSAVALDRDVTPELLVMLAWRAMLDDDCFCHEGSLRGVVREGGSAPVADRAIKLGKQLGYLRRWRPAGPPGTRWREELLLPAGGEQKLVNVEWFDGSFSLKELATLLLVIHGGGAGGMPGIAERFAWSHATTGKVIDALVKRGMVSGRNCGCPDCTRARDRRQAAGRE